MKESQKLARGMNRAHNKSLLVCIIPQFGRNPRIALALVLMISRQRTLKAAKIGEERWEISPQCTKSGRGWGLSSSLSLWRLSDAPIAPGRQSDSAGFDRNQPRGLGVEQAECTSDHFRRRLTTQGEKRKVRKKSSKNCKMVIRY